MIYLYDGDIPDGVVSGRSVAIDTETLGLNIFRDRLCLVQLSFGDGDAHIVRITGPRECVKLRNLLADDSVEKIFHFALFDLSVLSHNFGISIKNIYCTKIASKIARTYTDKHSLKDLCCELLNVTLNKEQQSSYWGGEISEEQKKYAANDVLYLHDIKRILDKILQDEGRYELARRCFDALQNSIVPLELEKMNYQYVFSH